jgi:hypothetical protein
MSLPMRKELFTGSVLVAMGGALGCSSGGHESSTKGSAASTSYTTPDDGNLWTQGQDLSTYAIGQENVLSNEDQIFAQMAADVTQMQNDLVNAGLNPALARGFHAKAHACALGTFTVASDTIPLAQRRGLFASDASYPVWVRFSNGVGFSESDKDTDVRGLAFKVMKVPGGGTQDFLMTNGPITPAPDSQQFVNFGKAQVAATVSTAGTPLGLGPIASMLETGGYLLEPQNSRLLWYIVNQATPQVLTGGTVLGLRFWSGGAIELGDSNGTPMDAVKVSAVPGVPQSDGSCTPVSALPNLLDSNYLRTDIVQRLQNGPACVAIEIQFQVDPAKQPIEDTSVEWLESDSRFYQVASVTIPQVDLTTGQGASEESFCENLSFTPWHAMPDHRPLGNIMRARKVVYATSAMNRGAAAEPTGDEFGGGGSGDQGAGDDGSGSNASDAGAPAPTEDSGLASDCDGGEDVCN